MWRGGWQAPIGILPDGPSLKLLNLFKNKGLAALA